MRQSMVPEIDVRSSVARKNYTGELNFTFDADADWLDIPFVEFSSPIKAELRYEIFEDDSVEVKGTIAFSLKGLCSRCLAEAEQAVTFEAEGVFAKDPEDEEYGYERGIVRLTEFLRDSVLFSMPARVLCRSCAEEE